MFESAKLFYLEWNYRLALAQVLSTWVELMSDVSDMICICICVFIFVFFCICICVNSGWTDVWCLMIWAALQYSVNCIYNMVLILVVYTRNNDQFQHSSKLCQLLFSCYVFDYYYIKYLIFLHFECFLLIFYGRVLEYFWHRVDKDIFARSF